MRVCLVTEKGNGVSQDQSHTGSLLQRGGSDVGLPSEVGSKNCS